MAVISLPATYRIDRVDLLNVDVEGGGFALLGAGEDLRWLGRVDQAVLEVYGSPGGSRPVGRLKEAGFHIDLRDNDGLQVTISSDELAYAYCSR